MDSSFREEASEAQPATKYSLLSLWKALSIIKWLTAMIWLTDEEREQAGIHTEHR